MGNLPTPNSVQKLQTALHAKAKAEADYRFYALYDKLYREDILAHAYAQCRSNRGAPGVDGQDFAAVEEYGLKQWLGELALALKEETYGCLLDWNGCLFLRDKRPYQKTAVQSMAATATSGRSSIEAQCSAIRLIIQITLPASNIGYESAAWRSPQSKARAK